MNDMEPKASSKMASKASDGRAAASGMASHSPPGQSGKAEATVGDVTLAPGGPAAWLISRSRALGWAALALLVCAALAWLSRATPPSVPAWAPAGEPAGLNALFEPVEINRWQRPHPVITSQHLSQVALSADGRSALAVGDDGTVLRSGDGGASWATVASGSKAWLFSVVLSADGRSALAVGDSGTVLRSGDGGASWTTVASGSQASLYSVALSADGRSALAVGSEGTVLRSGDGGASWATAASGSKASLSSVVLSADGRSVLAVGGAGTVLRSGDGGASWATVASGSQAWLFSVVLSADGRSALAMGRAGTVLRSGDGGASWATVASGSQASLYSVALSADGRSALAVGDDGTVLRSGDGGASWATVASGSQARLFSVVLSADGRSALAVGDSGTVLRSGDGGASWATVASGSQAWLFSVVLSADGRSALAVGSEGTVLRSGDGGASWATAASGSKASLRSVVLSADGRSALAVGRGGTVLRSGDGGASWATVASGSQAWLFSVVLSADGRSALAVGSDGTVLRSGDGGASWATVASGSQAILFSVVLSADGRSALAVGRGGTVLRSGDGGAGWATVVSGSKASLYSVVLSADGRSALALGNDGTVLRSGDGGASWAAGAQYRRYPAPIYGVLLVLASLAGLALAWQRVRRRRLTVQRRPGLLEHGVSDAPVSQADQDRMAFMPVVWALLRFLRSQGTRPPLTLAINAPWGMGKSSFMELLRGELRGLGVRPVWFNVWHHQHEELLLAPLLQAIVDQAVPSLWSWQGLRFRARLVRLRWHKGWPAWLGVLGLLSLPIYVALLYPRRSAALPQSIQGMADRLVRDAYAVLDLMTGGEWLAMVRSDGLGTLLAAWAEALHSDPFNGLWLLLALAWCLCIYLAQTWLLRPFPARPAQLLARLHQKMSLSQAEAQNDFKLRFRSHFAQVCTALAPRTLTVFIDDLDRCEPAKAAQLLEAANYLSDAGPCILVFGMARELVEAQVAIAHKPLAEEQAALARARHGGFGQNPPAPSAPPEIDRLDYARRYLRKIIQLDISLPSLQSEAAVRLLLERAVAAQPQAAETATDRAAPRGSGSDAAVKDAGAQKLADTKLKGGGTWWARAGRIGRVLWVSAIGGAFINLGALLWMQGGNTLKTLKAEQQVARSQLQDQSLVLYAEIEAGRMYEAHLRQQLAAVQSRGLVPATAAPSAAAAPQAPARTPAAKEPDAQAPQFVVRARLEMVVQHLKRMEAAVPGLERVGATGRKAAFEKQKATEFGPALAALQKYAREDKWSAEAVRAAARGTLASDAPGVTPAKPDPLAPERGEGNAQTASPQLDGQPWWPQALLLFPAFLLLGLALLRKDDFVIEETPEYTAAVKVWLPTLVGHAETASPRELKRFMNLCRYTVARLSGAGRVAASGNVQAEGLRLPEARVVEFCALWLTARTTMATDEKWWQRDFAALALPASTADSEQEALRSEQALLFAAVVGELRG